MNSDLAAQPAAQTFAYRDPLALATLIKRLLWAEVVAAIIGVVGSAGQLRLLSRMDRGAFDSYEDMMTAAELNDRLIGFIGLAQVALAITLGVLILVWIYRSNANARALGSKGMEYTPGWAVGWYFVPILSLWKPYAAFSEIWRASARGSDDQAAKTTSLLSRWWALWIVAGVTGQISLRLALAEDQSIGMLQLATVASQASDVSTIALDLIFLRIVEWLTRMQVAWRGAEPASAAPQPT